MAFTVEENKALIEKYPFLLPRNVFDDAVPDDYDYSYTLFEDIPEGWQIAFGMQMIEELREILVKGGFLYDYRILQIKEKFGGLRWYDNGYPPSVSEEYLAWEEKYYQLSYDVCIKCGQESAGLTTGWIMPLCRKCSIKSGKKLRSKEDSL